MLYTNKVLEFINKKDERILEICSLYGVKNGLRVQKDLNEKIKFIKDRYHKYLSLKESDNGITLINEKDDELYLILDTLEYKIFNQEGRIVFTKDTTMQPTILKTFNVRNRIGNCNWDIEILKAQKGKLNLLRLEYTSGKINYLTVTEDGVVKIHHEKVINKYLKSLGKNIDVHEIQWK